MNLKPHGSLKNRNATYPLPQEMAYTRIDGVKNEVVGVATIKDRTMTALDYKLLATLLYLTHSELEEVSGKGGYHEIEGEELLSIFSSYSGSKDKKQLSDQIWKSFKRISSLTVEYQRTDNDYRYEGISSMIDIERKTLLTDETHSTFRFQFPRALVPILLSPRLFAMLKVSFILEMTSKYSIALYQILVPYAELTFKNSIEASLDEWKGWLKVPFSEKAGSAWKRFAVFRRDILDPAINELNEKSITTGFRVSYELIRGGRGGGVKRIRFDVEKVDTVVEKKIKSPTSHSNPVVRKSLVSQDIDEDAIKLVVYFNKVWYDLSVSPGDLNPKDIEISKRFIGEKGLEWACRLVDEIYSFEDAPKWLGGLEHHKARAAAILRKKEADQTKKRHTKKEHKDSRTKRENIRLPLKFECKKFFDQLPEVELSEIEESIYEKNPAFKPYFFDKRDTCIGENIRNVEYFRWYLERIKNKSKAEIDYIFG